MKGLSAFFSSYNSAGSKSVKIIVKKTIIERTHDYKVPIDGDKNSVLIILEDNHIVQERYFDQNGEVYLDIDYTNHGNPKQHPIVPHEHIWYINKKWYFNKNRMEENK